MLENFMEWQEWVHIVLLSIMLLLEIILNGVLQLFHQLKHHGEEKRGFCFKIMQFQCVKI